MRQAPLCLTFWFYARRGVLVSSSVTSSASASAILYSMERTQLSLMGPAMMPAAVWMVTPASSRAVTLSRFSVNRRPRRSRPAMATSVTSPLAAASSSCASAGPGWPSSRKVRLARSPRSRR